jgi:dTDP-4-amino-4,6-dideoxygalactose transaminase
MRLTFLPFALPDTDQAEIDEVTDAIRSGWITTGPKVRQFEHDFAAYVGARHAIALNSATAALHLCLEAAGLQAGEEVITSTLTFAATAEVVRYFNARPVLVDVDPVTLNLDPECIEAAITTRTRAIIPVHLGGRACDMAAINTLARQHGLNVIEDAAHALPARFQGQLVGALSDFTCFSFYATKTMTTGEGGMITTDNDAWAERCRIMSLHGISKDAWKRYTAEGSWYYEIVAPGYKYNMTDVAAAMGLAQLRKLERMQARRAEIAAQYSSAFSAIEQVETPRDVPAGDQHAWHLYVLRIHPDRLTIDRARFMEELKRRNIGASVHFIPLHLHPYYRETYGFQPHDFPVAYREYLRMISLPIYSKMSDQDVSEVIEAVLDIVQLYTR